MNRETLMNIPVVKKMCDFVMPYWSKFEPYLKISLREVLFNRRTILMEFLIFLILIMTFGLVNAFDPGSLDYDYYVTNVAWNIIMLLFLGVSSIISAVTLVYDQIDEGKMGFQVMKPIKRRWILVLKYFSSVISGTVVIFIPMVIFYFIYNYQDGTEMLSHLDILWGLLVVSFFSIMGYTAMFFVISLVTKHPLLIGLVIFFIWDLLFGMAETLIRYGTVRYYTLSMANKFVPYGTFSNMRNAMDAYQSIGVLIVISVVFMIIASYLFERTEIIE